MIISNDIKFASNLRVLYNLKEKKGFKTLDETYKALQTTDMDSVIELLRIAYTVANTDKDLSTDAFIDLMDAKGIGFIKMTMIYKQVIEALVTSGMSETEITDVKNLAMKLETKKS